MTTSAIVKTFNCRALAALPGLLLSLCASAATFQVGGFAYPDAESLNSRQLVLNGATRSKEFSIGLYLQEKRSTVDGLMKLSGSKRVRLVAQGDIQTKQLGRVLMERIRMNATDDEKTRNILQIAQVGMVFAEIPQLGRGDVLTIDWIDQQGWTEFGLNGKRLGDPVLGTDFFPMMMKVWVGPKTPAEMRDSMLGLGTPLTPAAP